MAVHASLPGRVRSDLRRRVGPEALITDPDRLVVYESDALTTLRGRPLAAVFPATREQLIGVVRTLASAGIPYVPRGSGTGLAGGAIADGSMLVSTVRMNRVLTIDPDARRALVEPGVLTDAVSVAAAPHDLRYLPDPASAAACTIGGNVAMNSGGPHCLLHGVTADHVGRLEVVLPDGAPVWLDRGKGGGLDLGGLFVGSEGTLGIAARVELHLAPLAPSVGALLAAFDDLASAGAAVSSVLASGIVPVALELIDARTIRLVEASPYAVGLPSEAAAALVVESEGEAEQVEADLAAVVRIVRNCGARQIRRARNEEERAAIWQARKKAYGVLGRAAPDVLVQDAVVPRTALADLLPRIERAAASHGVRLASFFHAGDGNLHPNLLFDRRDPDQVGRVAEASREIMRLCVEAGGTITGEHGVGLDKVGYMSLVFTEAELEAQRAIKRLVDPRSVCNPGKLLPVAPVPLSGGGGHRPPTASGHGEALVPDTAVAPDTPAEVARWLASLPDDRVPVITGGDPEHAATVVRESEGGRPAVAVLSISRLDRLVEYRPADLTITVGAGMRIARLQQIVREEGQWLPCEGESAELSVGGLVAAAPPGHLDERFGPIRRQLLALQVAGRGGDLLSWGRPVVKNVAGYDMVRLWCGSRGRLGAITEVTLRLWPIPPERRTYRLEAEEGVPAIVARLARAAAPELDALLWSWTRDEGHRLRGLLLGGPHEVEARERRLRAWAAPLGVDISRSETPPARSASSRSAGRSIEAAAFRLSARRGYLATVLDRIRVAALPVGTRLEAHPGLGMAVIALEGGRPAPERDGPPWIRAAPDAVRISVERGGPADHAAAAGRRGEGEVRLERLILEALGGWRRHWLADYV